MGSVVIFTRVSVIMAPVPDPAVFVIPATKARVQLNTGVGTVLLVMV